MPAQTVTVYFGTIEDIQRDLEADLKRKWEDGKTRLDLIQLILTGCRTPDNGRGGLTCLCVWSK